MKIGKKIAVLLLVFIAAAGIYFVWPMGRREEKGVNTTYSVMENATLPVAYPAMLDQEMEPLFGHREEKAVTAERGGLLVLPPDRKLPVRFEAADRIRSLQYEIRTMDMEHLVERTELTGWTVKNGEISVILPIQNLLEADTEYCLGIHAELSDGTGAWYYVRIIETDSDHVGEMLALARDFSEKTFHYNSARELTMYMESSPDADNSSFGSVTLKNSFSQMTWGNLKVERKGAVHVGIRELSGDLANINLCYYVTRDGEQETETYEVTENFTMKWSRQRIYMMDYERTMNQVFTGTRDQFSGKRILLGISDGEDIGAKKSQNGKFMAYMVNRELWLYDVAGNENRCVFSFGGIETEDVRCRNRNHQISILELSETGDMDFLVYGYMNRGNHEGRTGIAYNHYDAGSNTVEEKFFLPASESFEELKLDLETLAHKGTNGVFYFYMAGSVYGIDLKSCEYVVAASGLDRDRFSVSADGSRLAWQEASGVYDSRLLHIMDLDTGDKTQIGEGGENAYRILGFVGSDCVYGVGNYGDYVMSNGRIMGLYLRFLEILDKNMECVLHYEKSGKYIREVRVSESRVHLTLVKEKEDGFFGATSDDTLVCNTETDSGKLDHIGWYASENKGRIYFVQLGKEISENQKIRRTAPKKMVLREGNEIDLSSGEKADRMEFYSYARGRLLGIFTDFADAVAASYDRMGMVMDGKHTMIWARANKPSSAYIRDITGTLRCLDRYRAEFSGESMWSGDCLLLEASGCTLNQMLYFVGKNMPVLLNTGEGSCLVLTGFDQSHVRVYDPVSGQTETMSMENAEGYFSGRGNDFICCVLR